MSNKRDSLGDRMKRYENVSRNYLARRIPVIIRIDGKAFHTFTRGMKKPFDSILMNTMKDTMKYLCENIQGCVLGYTQSDEITLVLTDYATITTDAWFGYNVQKLTSIAASMATMAFNSAFKENVEFAIQYFDTESSIEGAMDFDNRVYMGKLGKAIFDARAFSIPKDDVCNCLIWRQQDATRNSIQSVGQAYFSHKMLNGKSCNNIQEMLWQEYNVNWNDFPVECKRGACCIKQIVQTLDVRRSKWVIDTEPPIFTQKREYIEKLL